VHAERPITPQDKSREPQRRLYLRAKREVAFWSGLMWQVIKIGMVNHLKAPRRRLSVSRMRENLMSGSMWQGMETRQGDGTEALSQETERNGSVTPKSRRHPLTLPADGWYSR
jgi:hypothetical protein